MKIHVTLFVSTKLISDAKQTFERKKMTYTQVTPNTFNNPLHWYPQQLKIWNKEVSLKVETTKV